MDRIYVGEANKCKEQRFWEEYYNNEGTITILDEAGREIEQEKVLEEYHLPF